MPALAVAHFFPDSSPPASRARGRDRHGNLEEAMESSAGERTNKDPICGRMVTREDAPRTAHEGRSYFFCSEECKRRFDVAPSVFAYTSGAPPEDAWRRETEPGPDAAQIRSIAETYREHGTPPAEAERNAIDIVRKLHRPEHSEGEGEESDRAQ